MNKLFLEEICNLQLRYELDKIRSLGYSIGETKLKVFSFDRALSGMYYSEHILVNEDSPEHRVPLDYVRTTVHEVRHAWQNIDESWKDIVSEFVLYPVLNPEYKTRRFVYYSLPEIDALYYETHPDTPIHQILERYSVTVELLRDKFLDQTLYSWLEWVNHDLGLESC